MASPSGWLLFALFVVVYRVDVFAWAFAVDVIIACDIFSPFRLSVSTVPYLRKRARVRVDGRVGASEQRISSKRMLHDHRAVVVACLRITIPIARSLSRGVLGLRACHGYGFPWGLRA